MSSAAAKGGTGRVRSSAPRDSGPSSPPSPESPDNADAPAAGAHAAEHLVNEDATPGSGALPSGSKLPGGDVDGGAG